MRPIPAACETDYEQKGEVTLFVVKEDGGKDHGETREAVKCNES